MISVNTDMNRKMLFEYISKHLTGDDKLLVLFLKYNGRNEATKDVSRNLKNRHGPWDKQENKRVVH